MIAEKPIRPRAAHIGAVGSSAIRKPIKGISIPMGAKLRYAEAQHDDSRTTGRQYMADRLALSFAGATKPRARRIARPSRWSQGETTLISALLISAVLVCTIGVFYLAAYMRVAYQGRLIASMQAQISSETARQHALINEIGQLESPARIAQSAEQMGMVMGQKTHYVQLPYAPARQPAQSLAEVPTDSGAGALGDN